MQGRFNGEVVQDTTLSDMIFNVRRLVSLLSASMTLDPGDVIITGTPSGVGLSFKPPRFLKPGDVFEIEIEKLGVLRNPVVAEA
jgi:2-keto-4-pentenoate hydratase/2-oxohepta-3-ene-1,7-dioic acid hydratase in catechol pathway